MVEAAQIEQRLAFEPRTAPVEPGGRNESVARESNKPDFSGATEGRETAYSVAISDEAQRLAASGPAARPQSTSQPARQDLDAAVETSATSTIGSNAGAADDANETNQVTSFEGERTGNDTRNETEAGRTLGQVIDTFA